MLSRGGGAAGGDGPGAAGRTGIFPGRRAGPGGRYPIDAEKPYYPKGIYISGKVPGNPGIVSGMTWIADLMP